MCLRIVCQYQGNGLLSATDQHTGWIGFSYETDLPASHLHITIGRDKG